MTDVAVLLAVSMPTASAMVADLVRKRWVARRYSVVDCRAIALRLSRQGEKIEEQVRRALKGTHA